jgi:hypothetical protein
MTQSKDYLLELMMMWLTRRSDKTRRILLWMCTFHKDHKVIFDME